MQDKDTQKLLIVVGLVVVILLIARPKNSSLFKKTKKKSNPLTPPRTVSNHSVNEEANARICIDAMRMAIENGESQSAVNELNQELIKEYGIKLLTTDSGSLVAKNSTGRTIARE
jgi:FtsZ-interacting cell division protein ZipA